MKRNILIIFSVFACATFILLAALIVPLPVPYDMDFSVLYSSNRALLHGIDLYDYQSQLNFLQAPISCEITFFPYPYPPWYALTTLFLALMPVSAAARLWFLLNIAMLGIVTWLITPNWKGTTRLLVLLGGIIFVPVLGVLIVGQYSIPVLLGIALFIWSTQRESAPGVAMSFVLMTFKPHLGIFVILAGFGWLIYHRKTIFARRAMVWTLLAAIFLGLVGFIADPVWPLNYLNSLNLYRNLSGVQICGLCASLPEELVKVATGETNTTRAAGVAIFLAVGVAGLFAWQFKALGKDPVQLAALATLFTLLVSPYLLNYDYVLLLIPMILLINLRKWVVFIPYLLSYLVFAFGRNGNNILVLATLLVATICWIYRDEFAQLADIFVSEATTNKME